MTAFYSAASAAVVLAHLLFVLFVVAGGLLVVRRRWVAWVHLPCVAWAAVVEYAGWICPLTPVENALRERAGLPLYSGDFIAQYVFPLLYPADLTRRVQILLGSLALVVNATVYWRVARRHRASRPPTF